MAGQEQHTTDMRPVPAEATSHGARFWILSTLAAVLVIAAVSVGAFVAGRATRPSEEEVASRLASQAATARVEYGKRQQANLLTQRTELRAQFRKKMKKAVNKARDDGYSSGQQVGYTSGQAAGYSSGSAEGKQEGKQEGEKEGKKKGLEAGREQGEVEGYLSGFDDGTCYDPDTYEYVC